MSTTAIRSKDATTGARDRNVDLKLEVITIPVADVDRAKEFYGSLGWRLDADFSDGSDRAVQFTPPGSQGSIHFGKPSQGAPGSAQGLFLVVSEIEAARDDLRRRGVAVSEVFHFAKGPAPFGGIVGGLAPEHQSATRTATAGCCRRSRRGSQGASRATRRTRRRMTWRRRCGARRRRTASTRSGRASGTRTGRPGTPRTCGRSRPARSCRHEAAQPCALTSRPEAPFPTTSCRIRRARHAGSASCRARTR
jgi:catechol 2,3-dioxygenase-like lactoylglutathione lyase family enzyme